MTAKPSRFTFDLADLGFIYSVLCALSLIAINPWGVPRGGIWTAPKVYTLIVLALLTWTVLLVQLVRAMVARSHRQATPRSRPRFAVPASWWLAALLWLGFLGAGLLTVYYSPVKFRSAFMAHDEMGDGWLYWAWVAAFVLGNALLLRRFPQLFRAQLYGFLIGGALMALATVPQHFNWRLDYTATMGQVAPGNVLRSLIYQGQMPIGFDSHRGHAAFVVAATAILALVSLLRGWLKGRYAWPLYLLSLLGIYLTSTRGAQLAFGVGLIYLLIRFWRVGGARRKLLLAFVPLVLGGAVIAVPALGVSRSTRPLPSLEMLTKNPEAFASFRFDYWRIALDGIRERPLLGWGYNGFGLAFPYVNDFDKRFAVYLDRKNNKAVPIESLIGTDHYLFRYFGADGAFYRGRVMSNKAHNLFFDTALSVGLLGLGFYLLLLGVFIAVTARGQGWGLEAALVVYLVYGLTWFESAQFSHLAWWVLSAGLAMQLLPQRAPEHQPFTRRFASEAG